MYQNFNGFSPVSFMMALLVLDVNIFLQEIYNFFSLSNIFFAGSASAPFRSLNNYILSLITTTSVTVSLSSSTVNLMSQSAKDMP